MQLDFLLECKLIILYMLGKVDFPLTNAQIFDFMLGKEYAHFINLQQSLSELREANLVQTETTHNNTLYTLTPNGKETLAYFTYKIPHEIILDINSYLKDNKFKLKEDVSILSSYFQADNKEYVANCKILENNFILAEINISVPTEEQALKICNNWKSESQDIYSFLIKTLIK